MKYRDWGLFFLLGAIWGSSFLFIKIGLEDLQPLTLVSVRIFFGALGLWAIIALMRLKIPRSPATIGRLVLLGLTNTALPFVLITWGEKSIDSGVASVLNATVPLYALIIAHFFLADEKITWLRLGGLITGFAGVALIFSERLIGMISSGGLGSVPALLGQLAVVLAAVLYAGSSIFARSQVRSVHPFVMAGFQIGSALVWSIIGMLLLESPVRIQMNGQTILALGWLGILGTCVAYLIYFHLINVWGATRTTLVTYLIPVLGVRLGVVVLGENADWRLLVGFGLIASGIALVNWRHQQPALAPEALVEKAAP